MAFTKITNQQLENAGVTNLPNQPQMPATQLKEKFEETSRTVIAPAFNNLIDELGMANAASDIGANTPTGRTGTSVQAVINSISDDLATAENNVTALLADEHTHANKALLDTYTQTEADLAQAVADDHTHSNKSLLDTYTQTEADIAQAIADDHTHANKTELDKIGETSGRPTYDGQDIGGDINDAISSVDVVYNGNIDTLTASGKDSISIIAGANVTLLADPTHNSVIIASAGGGGTGGDMYKADYDPLNRLIVDKAATLNDGTNALAATIPQLNFTADINIDSTSLVDGHLLTYDNITSKWVNRAPDKSIVRYAGAINFADLATNHATYLDPEYEDAFFLISDGGDIQTGDAALYWTSNFHDGQTIPADSHIAVIDVNRGTGNPPSYKYDDFGGFVDISGKADKTEIIHWIDATLPSGQRSYNVTSALFKTTSRIIQILGDGGGAYSSVSITADGTCTITFPAALTASLNISIGISNAPSA